MSIRLVKETEEEQREWRGITEKCDFGCGSNTIHWHVKSNTPICPPCAKKFKTADIGNYKYFLSDWVIVDGYCATRYIKDKLNTLENRVAFIEKTPRVRTKPFTEYNDFQNWVCGVKGQGGSFDANHEEEGNYGFDQESRDWCDARLREMGYIF